MELIATAIKESAFNIQEANVGLTQITELTMQLSEEAKYSAQDISNAQMEEAVSLTSEKMQAAIVELMKTFTVSNPLLKTSIILPIKQKWALLVISGLLVVLSSRFPFLSYNLTDFDHEEDTVKITESSAFCFL